MDRRERTDAQLVAVAADGDVGAFGALVHRHAARIDAIVAPDADPDARLVEVFTTAMTRLADAPEDVAGWLESIARATMGHHHEPLTDPAPTDLEDLAPERLDAVWQELARRWPSGRAAPPIPNWLPWVTAAAVTIALSAGIPWWVLGPEAPEPELVELRAFPLVEGPDDAPEEPEPIEEEPLPTFEFPVPPEEPEEPPTPAAPTDDPPSDDDAEPGDDEPTDVDTDGGSPSDPDDGDDDGAESTTDDEPEEAA